MEGALSQGNRSSLTGGRWKRLWLPRLRARRNPSDGAGATESVRGRIADLARGRQRRGDGGAASSSTRRSLRDSRGEAAGEEVEAERAPSSARSPGVGLPQGGPAPRNLAGRSRGYGPSGGRQRARSLQRTHAAGSGIGRSTGARIVRLVADVGEKHLLHARRGEPRGEPSGCGVARAGRLIPRQGSLLVPAIRVRGERVRTVQ